MPTVLAERYKAPPHPIHAVLLAGLIPLFLGVLLSDLAYAHNYEVQWKNFSSWLIAGALVFAGLTLVWSLVELFHHHQSRRRSGIYSVLLLLIWPLGFINALVHAKDAWASMPEALIISVVVVALAIAATWIRFAALRIREMG